MEVIQLSKRIEQGQIIKAEDIVKVQIGKYGVSDSVIKDEKKIIGKFNDIQVAFERRGAPRPYLSYSGRNPVSLILFFICVFTCTGVNPPRTSRDNFVSARGQIIFKVIHNQIL